MPPIDPVIKNTATPQRPRRLYVAQGADMNRDGANAIDYLARRYGKMDGQWGFFGDDASIVFFHDRGHRDEFIQRFGGVAGTADYKGRQRVSLEEALG